MFQRFKAPLISGIVILLVAYGIYSIIVGFFPPPQSQDQEAIPHKISPTSTGPSVVLPSLTPANWQVYTSSSQLVTLKYPSPWNVNQFPSSGAFSDLEGLIDTWTLSNISFSDLAADPNKANQAVNLEFILADSSHNNQLDFLATCADGKFPCSHEIYNQTEYTTLSIPAIVQGKGKIVITKKQDYYLVITVSIPDQANTQVDSDIKAIFNTISFNL